MTLTEPWKKAYYNRRQETHVASFWYPDRRCNPWRKIKRDLQPRRIEDLKNDGIKADIENYADYVDREPENPDIYLALKNLEFHSVNGETRCKCTECDRNVTAQNLGDCKHIHPNLIRELEKIRAAFEEEARRVRSR